MVVASHLDKDGESSVREVVRMARERRKGLILITHRKESLELVDKVWWMKKDGSIECVERTEGGEWSMGEKDGRIDVGHGVSGDGV